MATQKQKDIYKRLETTVEKIDFLALVVGLITKSELKKRHPSYFKKVKGDLE